MAENQDRDQDQAEQPANGGSSKKLIFIILGAVLLVGASVGGTLFFLGGSGSPQAEAPEAEAEAVPLGDPRYVDLGKAFTVNLEGGAGLLRISVALLVYTDALEDAIVQHMPRIRNTLVLLFSGLAPADVQARSGKDQLKANALAAIEKILSEYSDTRGMDLFFTDFVTQ